VPTAVRLAGQEIMPSMHKYGQMDYATLACLMPKLKAMPPAVAFAPAQRARTGFYLTEIGPLLKAR
jgi:hypothetical protein